MFSIKRSGKNPEGEVVFELVCGSVDKESAFNGGDLGSIAGLGRSPGEGKGYPLQYTGLENCMDCIVHGVAKSCTRLSDFHSLTHEILVSREEEKRILAEQATYSKSQRWERAERWGVCPG